MRNTPAAAPVPLSPPPPPPGIEAWLAPDAPGAVRLPWLPMPRVGPSGGSIFAALVIGWVGLQLLAGGSTIEIALAVAVLGGSAVLAGLDLRRQLAQRAGSFVAIDAARGTLHLAQAETKLDLTLPVVTLGAVAVQEGPEGAWIVLRREGAPDVMASGLLPPPAARSAAAALAWRLRLDHEAPAFAPGLPAPRESAPIAPAADPPQAQRIPLGPSADAVGQETVWLGLLLILMGGVLLLPGVPALMRWGLAPALVVLGVVVLRRRTAWAARARGKVAVVDRVAGTLTLRGVSDGEAIVVPIAAVRRVVLLTGGEDVRAAVDCLDRPRLLLPAGGTRAEIERRARDLAEAVGCPMEPAP